MKHLIYILLCIFGLASCQSEDVLDGVSRTGTLQLSLRRGGLPVVANRAVAEGLAIDVIAPDGTTYVAYAPDAVPAKIVLEADVEYTLRVYTDNQTTWATANEGLGEACYYGEVSVTVGEDETVFVTYDVPLINYAVTYTLPEDFSSYFKAHTFTVTSGERSVTLDAGQRAYFAVPDAFAYSLKVTNTDGRTFHHPDYTFEQVKAGKIYNVIYHYGNGLDDIEIEEGDDEPGTVGLVINYEDAFTLIPEELIVNE